MTHTVESIQNPAVFHYSICVPETLLRTKLAIPPPRPGSVSRPRLIEILNHAAIVARELGVPAVVRCVNATTRLRDGDRVIVDGGRGTVEIVSAT
jgi:hypothetical protein